MWQCPHRKCGILKDHQKPRLVTTLFVDKSIGKHSAGMVRINNNGVYFLACLKIGRKTVVHTSIGA
jgi:hypothetical protein